MDVTDLIGPVAFILGAGAFLGLSLFVMRETQPYSRKEEPYEKKRRRRVIGKILVVAAGLCVCVAIIQSLLLMNRY